MICPNMSAATVSYSHAGFIGGVLAGLTTKNQQGRHDHR